MIWTLMNATGYPANIGGNPPGTSEFRNDVAPDAAARHARAAHDGSATTAGS